MLYHIHPVMSMTGLTGLPELADLKPMLSGSRWVLHTFPFPHCVAGNVFNEKWYGQLAASHKKVLARGYSDQHEPGCLSRRIAGYDAYSLNIDELPSSEPLWLFASRAWHDVIALVLGIDATGDVNVALHSHPPGSRSGHIHNDLNPGFFVDKPTSDGINLANWRQCSYETGRGAAVPARETIRAAAMLLYLNNGPWQPGDGGETGLYTNSQAKIEAATVKVPPLDNSLLLFECTPYSFHTFIKTRKPRHSLIMWLHRPKSTVVRRWGPRSIVGWSNGR